MKRPVLISIMAVMLMATAIWLAAMFTYSFAQVARFDQPRDQAGFLLGLVVCFLTGAVSVGLWHLDPGARRVVLALPVMWTVLFFVGTIIDTANGFSPFSPAAIKALMMTLCMNSIIVYLYLPHVRRSFQKLDLIVLNLK